MGGLIVGLLVLASVGCATQARFEDDDGDSSTSAGQGGTTSADGGSGGSGGGSSACAIDCSTIAAGACQVAMCNEDTGQCELTAGPDGTPCDDGQFCTTGDTCQAGMCEGGPPNTCGLAPMGCMEITCDETTDTCTQVAQPNGAACQDPNNLCITGGTCQNGLCLGGAPNDCFFFPVSDDCHVAECNPMNGMCEEVVGNEGGPCVDTSDLCTVNKTCTAGVCQGGAPKNCSHLTQGCVLGVCDSSTGVCVTQNLMNNDPCDDLNPCTSGETCQNGQCINGTPITQCINGDSCCPSGCTSANDIECGHADCQDLLTTQNVWGLAAVGFDLRQWTSNLLWLGCPNNGCTPSNWYCNYDPVNQVLQFGVTTGTVRALFDPNNQLGGQYPTSHNGCCSASSPTSICNGPDNVDGPVNSADALCDALGYQNGQLIASQSSNFCPEIYATNTSGQVWASDFVQSNGYGQQWQCSTFK